MRRHGHPARHRARPAYRRRGRAADVAADAGLQRLADPGAAGRQRSSSSSPAGAAFLGGDGRGVLGLILPASRSRRRGRPEHRVESSVGSALAAYGLLLRDGTSWRSAFIGGFGIASFFVYLANSSFVLIDHYGLTPTQYSVAFSINAVSFFGVSQLDRLCSARVSASSAVMRIAVVGFRARPWCVLLAVSACRLRRALAVMAVLLFIGYGFLGLVIPTTAVLALEEHGEIAGTASALMGTLHFVTGAVAMGMSAPFFDGTALPMVAGIAPACSSPW